jgi:hypothetical protein
MPPRPIILNLPAESLVLPAQSVAETLNRFVTADEFGVLFQRKERATIRREMHWAARQQPAAALRIGNRWFCHLGRYLDAKGAELRKGKRAA